MGVLPEIRRDRLAFIGRLITEYEHVVKLPLINMTTYFVSHPEGVKRVLQDNHRNYMKGRMLDTLRRVAGNGLFTSEGDFWLRQRRLMQPAFHRRRIEGLAELMTQTTGQMLDRWERTADQGSVIDIEGEMSRLTMSIVSQALFGQTEDDENKVISPAVTVLLEDVTFRFDRPLYPPDFIPTPRNRRFKKARDVLDRTIFGIIERRRRQGNPDRVDLLSMLMGARDEESGQGMDDKQLRDEVLTMFVAGHETTAVTLTWALYLLSRHPGVARRLRDELDQVLNGQPPTVDNLSKLTYTRMVLDETLRLYPAAWMLQRQAIDEDHICGYRIPAGAQISISPYAMHHHPAYWKNPEGFDPGRFRPGHEQDRPRFAYMPFGGGPRQCIGKSFSLMESQLILAMVAQRYALHLNPGHQVVAAPKATLRPRGGMPMNLHDRHPYPSG
jgi:cytochrome P450